MLQRKANKPFMSSLLSTSESYFIRFDDGASLELMRRADIDIRTGEDRLEYCHIAFSLGRKIRFWN